MAVYKLRTVFSEVSFLVGNPICRTLEFYCVFYILFITTPIIINLILESYDPFLPAPSGVTNEPLPVELGLSILVDKIIMKDLLLTIMIKIQAEMFSVYKNKGY